MRDCSRTCASCIVYVFVSLSHWLADYEILAFEKPCFHYQKISTESRQFSQGVNGNEPIESMQLYTLVPFIFAHF